MLEVGENGASDSLYLGNVRCFDVSGYLSCNFTELLCFLLVRSSSAFASSINVVFGSLRVFWAPLDTLSLASWSGCTGVRRDKFVRGCTGVDVQCHFRVLSVTSSLSFSNFPTRFV